jgi:hypothetical protein
MTPDSSSISNYEVRKQLLDEVKNLSTEEYYELFRILKKYNVDYSENSNGIFFDLASVSQEVFDKIKSFMEYSKAQKKSEEDRTNTLHTLRQETNIDGEETA